MTALAGATPPEETPPEATPPEETPPEATPPGAPPPPAAGSPRRSPYIAGPLYDWLFFLLPPALSVLAGVLISGTRFATRKVWFGDHRATGAALMIGALTHAHLVAVFFRSHANPSILRLHPIRFLVVPIALFVAMMSSAWVLVTVTVLVVFWDVYHSGLQTFGLARIYDRNHGNDPNAGRRLDFWLSHVLYAGPILAGAVMLTHVRKLELFEDVGATFFAAIPAFLDDRKRYLTRAVIAGGALFIGYYVLAYRRLRRQGYRVSWLKVYLLASTGLCSIYTWGFNSWGQAFFIMNLFHAVQYLGLVWWSEGRHLKKRLGLASLRAGGLIAGAGFFGLLAAYGYWAEIQTIDTMPLWCITQVVAILHFWYDGFIWSVRRAQV